MAQFQNNIASKRTVDVASRKREKFDLHHTVVTTMPFGYCQPIHTYKMIPNSKHNVSVKSLVRFTPMVTRPLEVGATIGVKRTRDLTDTLCLLLGIIL